MKKKGKTGADFLKMLCGLAAEEKPKVKPKPKPVVEKKTEEPGIKIEFPPIKVEGSVTDYDSWFNAETHDFTIERPPYSIYQFEDRMMISTVDKVPPPPVTLHQSLSKFNAKNTLKREKIAPILFNYHDLLYVDNDCSNIRSVAAFHVANTIMSNIMIQAEKVEGKHDSGYTPATVLVLCPMKVQAYAFITEVLNFLPIDAETDPFNMSLEHIEKLNTEYDAEPPENVRKYKPADYVEIFGGVTDQDFKMGIRFFPNKVSLYQKMAKSQMIIASPFALMKHDDLDFLSSIEVLVLDSLDVLLTQNHEACFNIVSKLNEMPSNVKSTPWNRLRAYCADKNHKKMRQSIGYSSVLTPDMRSLFSDFVNIKGSIISRPLLYPPIIVKGANIQFHRIPCDSHQSIGESQYQYFIQKIIPMIKQWRNEREDVAKRTIIYFVSSMRFYQIRKYITEQNIEFLELGDAATKTDLKLMKKSFQADPNAVMLMTERFYFHYRPQLANVERTVFILPPTYPQYFSEISGGGETHIYFTQYDEFAIERVVGSTQTQRIMTHENALL